MSEEKSMASKVQQLRNRFHGQVNQDDGIYLSYGRTEGGIKGGVKKILELLKMPNLASITTKLNSQGGIDIVKLNFKSSSEKEIKEERTNSMKGPRI